MLDPEVLPSFEPRPFTSVDAGGRLPILSGAADSLLIIRPPGSR